MSSVDRKIERTIGMLAWEHISKHPNCTRNDLYAQLEMFSTKQIKRVLKKYEGQYWTCRKIVEHRGYKDYVTTYFYQLVPNSDFNDS